MASGAQRRIKSISYAKYGYIFILPFFLVYFFFQLWPLINTFIVSFHGNGKTVEDWVGLQNYKDVLFGGEGRRVRVIHESFFRCLKNTVILWVGNFIPQLALSLSLAVWFTEAQLKIPGKGFFKVVMYLPNIITAASVAVLFLQLMGQSETNPGAINFLLYKMGIVKRDSASLLYHTVPFIEGVWQSRIVIMFIQTWMWFGNTMIMLMSGIQGINPSLFEAASIDGASSGQVFRKITLPLLTPIMAYTLITSMIGGLQMFDIPFLYTKTGNVKDHLKTVAVMIFQYFHAQANENKMGYAGAVSVLLFFITLALGLIAFYMTRDKDEIAKKKQRKKIAKQAKLESKQFGGISL
ncbi:carbohydrate ABC transporter permease [Ruminococcus flavefaciens]|jgi:multiple sugar transport system permease protein|uniref:Multiple sugar transport system permease protein n=1 Tax=Ruminococcus flavefaciens TaxID=1265 RepID=A0A315YHU5_RUMFL|nr:sugar ABC transporter permease [Ruminococcus flavefaciens]MBQ6169284.1 sugar ABC transporter permease [Ruminococcus sp.]PWJ10754.1 multiple sugar transport system permease protein [Ruminococcus flavefaciens]SSA51330.1 multiple sugar transport system permease protein [Ruminococcus flavefaciens]